MAKKASFNPDDPKFKNLVVHSSGKAGGVLVGERHSNNGIKAINKSTGQPLEMEGGEVVITRNAVSDPTKRSFNGKQMTNREILSAINVSGGGVNFADGGELQYEECEYEYGGETKKVDHILFDISKCGCEHGDEDQKLEDGGKVDENPVLRFKNSFINTYPQLFEPDNKLVTGLAIEVREGMSFLFKFETETYKDFVDKFEFAKEQISRNMVYATLYVRTKDIDKELRVKRIKLVRPPKKNTVNQLNISNFTVKYQPHDIVRILNSVRFAKSLNWTNFFFGSLDDNNPMPSPSPRPADPDPKDPTPSPPPQPTDPKPTDENNGDDEIIESSSISLDIITALDELAEKDNYLSDDQYSDAIDFINSELARNRIQLQLNPLEMEASDRVNLIKKQNELLMSKLMVISEFQGNSYGYIASILRRLSSSEQYKDEKSDLQVIGDEINDKSVTYSDKFKNWFGDWESAIENGNSEMVSKAVDEKGVPLVYYNGSSRKKYTYRGDSNGVFYLAEKKSYAEWFAKNAMSRTPEGNFLMKVYVSLKNPIDLTVFKTDMVDLYDIVTYISVFYPSSNIFDVLPDNVSSKILMGEKTNVMMRAWQLIRNYPKLNTHLRKNTLYDGYLYYENNPSDIVDGEQNITKAIAIFKSAQVKLTSASLFSPITDDFRFKFGGKLES